MIFFLVGEGGGGGGVLVGFVADWVEGGQADWDELNERIGGKGGKRRRRGKGKGKGEGGNGEEGWEDEDMDVDVDVDGGGGKEGAVKEDLMNEGTVKDGADGVDTMKAVEEEIL